MVWGVRWVPSVSYICSLTLDTSGLLGHVSLCALGWHWANLRHRPQRQVGYVFWLSVDGYW